MIRDVFIIPHEERYIVYAPLVGLITLVNGACAAEIQDFVRTGNRESLSPEIADQLGDLDQLLNAMPPSAICADAPFLPTMTTLFVTNRCNLACRYCYARAGEKAPAVIPMEFCRAAIDWILENARLRDKPPHLGFHGGGEPTCGMEIIETATKYALERTADNPHPLRLGIATNGVMSDAKADFIGEHFQTITLSLDGPEEIQDEQRPMRNGKGSFREVMRFVENMHRHKVPFVIRSSVTSKSVEMMPEMVRFFAGEVKPVLVHFEPLYERGRCLDRPEQLPDPERFVQRYLEAIDVGRQHKLPVRYSAARIGGVFNSFCGCSQDSFNVAMDGNITGCYEVLECSNPLSEKFFFGHFDASTRRFVIDQERLAALRRLTVDSKRLCDDCFAKWNCSGDCPVKVINAETVFDYQRPSVRCEINRKITKYLLLAALRDVPCVLI